MPLVKPIVTKPFTQSSTIQGIALACAPLLRELLELLGVQVAENDLVEVLVGLIGFIGIVLAVIGRQKADMPLKGLY